MAQKPTELDSFLKSGKTALYRHGDKNRPSPFMRLFKMAAAGITMASAVGCSTIDHLQYGTTASDFDEMTDIVETTLPNNNQIHVLSLSRYAPYQKAPETKENTQRFHQDIKHDTGAHIDNEHIIEKGYKSFRNSMPIALSMIDNISKEKECLVIPLDHRKIPEMLNAFLPAEVNKYVPAFSNISRHALNNFTNYHEAWHCSFFANLDHYLKKHNIPAESESNFWARNHYVTHIGETLSDTAALAEIVYNDITSDQEVMETFQHLRTLYVSQGHHVRNSTTTPTVSYYTAPAMKEMQAFIIDKGIDTFRAMPKEDVAKQIIRIAEENTLSYEQFRGMWSYTNWPLHMADQIRTAQKGQSPDVKGLDQHIATYKQSVEKSTAYAEKKLKNPGFSLTRRLGID